MYLEEETKENKNKGTGKRDPGSNVSNLLQRSITTDNESLEKRVLDPQMDRIKFHYVEKGYYMVRVPWHYSHCFEGEEVDVNTRNGKVMRVRLGKEYEYGKKYKWFDCVLL